MHPLGQSHPPFDSSREWTVGAGRREEIGTGPRHRVPLPGPPSGQPRNGISSARIVEPGDDFRISFLTNSWGQEVPLLRLQSCVGRHLDTEGSVRCDTDRRSSASVSLLVNTRTETPIPLHGAPTDPEGRLGCPYLDGGHNGSDSEA